ncbi:MAG: hypothetical protein JWM02_907 [Frankiales bacterium]|nr:hypothetical protein [Frankiales bacterium]
MALDHRGDESRQIEHVKEDLLREFAALPEAVVTEEVSQMLRHFTRAPVRSFVPVLVRRGVRERLRHLK